MMAKWRFVCNYWPEYVFAGIGQFRNGVLELDDDEQAQVILNHYQFGALFFLQDDDGNLHTDVQAYLAAKSKVKSDEAQPISDEGAQAETVAAAPAPKARR
jgi:hypothetical protein